MPTRSTTSPAARTALVALCAAVALAIGWVLHARSDFLDLSVYRWAGQMAFEPSQLYDIAHPVNSLRFTYTPAAAVLFAGLEPVGGLDSLVFTLVSLAALGRMAWLVARAAGGWWERWSVLERAALVGALALCLEPSVETLRLGQVDFLLGWLVLEDLLGPRRRVTGALVGLAAAIKLTPAIYLVYLLVTARVRAVAVGAATFAAIGAIGFAALPEESRAFWSGTGGEAGRLGLVESVGNQSINGIVWRLAGTGGNDVLWLALAVASAVACLWLARSYHRAGEELVAVGLAALAGLLASPVSWSHHWVMVVPLLVGLTSLPRLGTVGRVVVGACYLVLCSRIIWRVPHDAGLEFSHDALQTLAASAYPLVALALLAVALISRPRSRP